jgi:hypothetical protein
LEKLRASVKEEVAKAENQLEKLRAQCGKRREKKLRERLRGHIDCRLRLSVPASLSRKRQHQT